MSNGAETPLLLKLKGNRRCFFGDMALGSHAGCSSRFGPKKSGKCYEESSSSTVEVAALFLIESTSTATTWSLHRGLRSPNGKPTEGARTDIKYNGRELLTRAWAVTEQWFKEFEREGLEALRAKDRGPLAGTRLGFY